MRTAFPASTLISLLLAGLVFADEARGIIQRVDTERGEIRVEIRGRGMRGLALPIAIDRETVIEIGHQPATLGDLKTGDRVRVLYENREGRRVALAVAGRAPLQLNLPALGSSPAPAADPNAFTGTLQRVALTDREIVVVGPGSSGSDTETTFSVPENIPITRDGKPIKLDDLKEGEKVAVIKGNQRDGKWTAVEIRAGAVALARDTGRSSRIERIRQFLHMADEFLQQREQQGSGPP